jgi:signal transduction histidine kinase/CheY-like chemotaxis protein
MNPEPIKQGLGSNFNMKMNTLSPFWIKFDSVLFVKENSVFFNKYLSVGSSFQDILDIKQPRQNKNETSFTQLNGKLILFYINGLAIKFRGTIHEVDDQFVILAWPALNKIEDIQKYKLGKYMSHPASTITDTLILKDVLTFSKEKLHRLELKRFEAEKEQEIANKSNIAKSQFLANMSHEIRTPLNGVLGMIELLQSTELENEQLEMLEIISRSGKNLLRILNDILDFSKIDAEKLEFESLEFNLVENVTNICNLLQHEADARRIDLKLNYDDSFHQNYIGDPTRVAQVISNVISNAIKFTHKGGVDVNLSKLKNNMIQILVKDTGIGISEKSQASLFKVFSQADSSTTRMYGGTGLGLVIVKKLVERMGGTVKLESIVNVGTSFTISLNLEMAKEDISKNPSLQNILPFKDIELGSKFPIRILVAEDNPVNQIVMKMMLARLGFTNCKFVLDGEKVLEALRLSEINGIPDYSLILMDMQMPRMDGVQATKILKKEYGDNSPRICAVTANAFKEDLDKCFSAGMDDCLTKPVSLDELKNIIYLIARKIIK